MACSFIRDSTPVYPGASNRFGMAQNPRQGHT